ncbi:MAG: chromosome segregation protein [Candidatus Promineifilaceae bacterium]|jgi:chromosome segregation protein
MHLKSLEIVGFKSFADKTKLEFEPGMTAIVGPNGCGKSNVADALRWVLGEQSAKALRGSQMIDCIFNGSDSRKPMGMAEVSVTFTDCENTLATEYNEVTISRRVFKSGEAAYFINKTPCRLKDVRRLFMDTGIGTNSYSMLEQGRIDHVLSSRPEDRRAIFEEASGIMKYKADKKEAIRKLDHTEANLLRLSDVIREVKRQIGSLQRQAGKARRYKTLRDELKQKDLFVTKQRLSASGTQIAAFESDMETLDKQQSGIGAEVQNLEKAVAELRNQLVSTQNEIGKIMEAGVQATSKLKHTREMIDVNRQRIAEYSVLAKRDESEIEDTRKQLDVHKQQHEERGREMEATQLTHADAQKDLEAAQQGLTEYLNKVESLRSTIHGLREQSVQLESRGSRLQNQLVELESHQRQSIIQKERLSTEKAQFERIVSDFGSRQKEMQAAIDERSAQLNGARSAQDAAQEQHSKKQAERTAIAQTCAKHQESVAAESARIEVLKQGEAARDGLPEGARLLLDDDNPLGVKRDAVSGALAGLIEGLPGYEKALETALGKWVDAVLIKHGASGRDMLRAISSKDAGSVHLIANDVSVVSAPALPKNAVSLLAHVRFDAQYKPAFERLLGHIIVVDTVDDIPIDLPKGVSYVTTNGVLATDTGELFYHCASDTADSLLAVKHRVAEIDRRLMESQEKLTTARATLVAVDDAIASAAVEVKISGTAVDEARHEVGLKRGELDVITREAKEAGQRLETVTWELDALLKQGADGTAQRESITTQIHEVQVERNGISEKLQELTQQLKDQENQNAERQSAVTEKRIKHAEITNQLRHLQQQQEGAQSRINDFEAAIQGRTQGVSGYKQTISDLNTRVDEASAHITEMEEAVLQNKVESARYQTQRETQNAAVQTHEAQLQDQRTKLESARSGRSNKEVELTRLRMRQQNQEERVTSDYKMTLEDVLSYAEPEWADSAPQLDEIETSVEELRTKLEAMGPVNLVAIEEYHELEERFAFLTAQEQDLVNSKKQLMEMIRKINNTTSEMFRTTFDKVNINFQEVYKKLFNGGTAKLVLVDEVDVLECGIEIIARPPGKRLQNVSLLSGGERTMTAVALLFAIYMIKPSPFCMLDELDAALDESNIGRFVAVLKSFVMQSQFVIITHNRKTIAAADVLYGVTMPNKGVSNIVSMKFRDFETRENMADAVGAVN